MRTVRGLAMRTDMNFDEILLTDMPLSSAHLKPNNPAICEIKFSAAKFVFEASKELRL
jgi:hypothetical protein